MNLIEIIKDLIIGINPKKIIDELSFDIPVGVAGYTAAIELEWIKEFVNHIGLGLFSALVCCAGVHYFKKFLIWFDKKITR